MVPCHSFLMPEWIYCCICMICHSMLFLWAYKKLFRLKSRRNKRSEPYYYPLLWRALRGGRLTILSWEILHGIYIRSIGKLLSSETFNRNLVGYWLTNWDLAKFLVAAILPELENIRTDVGISVQGSFIKLRSFINPNSYHLLDLYLVNWDGTFNSSINWTCFLLSVYWPNWKNILTNRVNKF